jgi:hypothetical protein
MRRPLVVAGEMVVAEVVMHHAPSIGDRGASITMRATS